MYKDIGLFTLRGTWLIVLVVVIIIGLLGVVGWGLGWITLPGRITSVGNVEAQWYFAYTYIESLQATAFQVCAAEKALAQATTENEKAQRRSHLLAIEQNYARIKAGFDARLENMFEAKVVAPPDIPRRAPSLYDMKLEACD